MLHRGRRYTKRFGYGISLAHAAHAYAYRGQVMDAMLEVKDQLPEVRRACPYRFSGRVFLAELQGVILFYTQHFLDYTIQRMDGKPDVCFQLEVALSAIVIHLFQRHSAEETQVEFGYMADVLADGCV